MTRSLIYAAAHVKEVSRFAAMQLNDVRRACAEGPRRSPCNRYCCRPARRSSVPTARLRFTRIFLKTGHAFRADRLAEQRVAVSAACRRGKIQIALLSNHQRVDFDQRGSRSRKNGCRAHKDFGDAAPVYAELNLNSSALIRHPGPVSGSSATLWIRCGVSSATFSSLRRLR